MPGPAGPTHTHDGGGEESLLRTRSSSSLVISGGSIYAVFACLHRWIHVPSLADKIGSGSSLTAILIGNPQSAALLCLGLYGAVLLLWLPLWCLALAITAPGVHALTFGVVYLAGRWLARTMSYPGNVPTVIRDIEYEYAAQMSRKLEHCATKLREWTADLRVVVNASVPVPHPFLARHHVEVCFLRKHMLGVLLQALQKLVTGDHLQRELRLTESACRDARQLLAAVEKAVLAIDEVMPAATRLTALHGQGAHNLKPLVDCTAKVEGAPANGHQRSTSSQGGRSKDNVRPHVMLDHVVDAAEHLRRLAPVVKRDKPADENGCFGVLKHMVRAKRPWDNVVGVHLMREELCTRMAAQQVWISASQGARLDCCLVPAQRRDQHTGKSAGLLIYFNPNAGHYECSTHAPFSSDWVDLYTSIGCDVLLFNYRGYGRSTGTPDPFAIKKDAELVVKYARETLRAERIAVHGESIGGMFAAHVAAHCQGVDLLIADRTFTSLAAVADRLMCPWAGAALHFFTGWKEIDVVSDYVSASCHKLICCDPNDEIIIDTASLKVGVAVSEELGDRKLAKYSLPRCYLVAEATGSSPSSAVEGSGPNVPSTPQQHLSEAAVAHWAACVDYLARRSRQHDMRRAMERKETRASVAAHLAEVGGAQQFGFDTDADLTEVEESDMESETSSSMSDWGSPVPLTVLQHIWRTLARCDGMCGLMLGHAVAKGPEAVRAWTCCLVQWAPVIQACSTAGGPHRRPSEQSPNLPVDAVRREVEEIAERRGPEIKSLEEDLEISYVLCVLAYLDDRIRQDAAKLLERHRSKTSGAASAPAVASCGEQQSCPPVESPLLGHLLPLQCGHNASFSEAERQRLLYHLAEQGWCVDAHRE